MENDCTFAQGAEHLYWLLIENGVLLWRTKGDVKDEREFPWWYLAGYAYTIY